MSTLLIGASGSMGKRYQAILKSLGTVYCGVDETTPSNQISDLAKDASRIIIASPTDTHFSYIKEFAGFGVPILCEKPVTKSFDEIMELANIVEANKTNLAMVMQYELLVQPEDWGHSEYNYFRHGNDGLAWDCFQIIALAKSKISLGETSPIWRCMINGRELNIRDMDWAYFNFTLNWLTDPQCKITNIMGYHLKVHKWLSQK